MIHPFVSTANQDVRYLGVQNTHLAVSIGHRIHGPKESWRLTPGKPGRETVELRVRPQNRIPGFGIPIRMSKPLTQREIPSPRVLGKDNSTVLPCPKIFPSGDPGTRTRWDSTGMGIISDKDCPLGSLVGWMAVPSSSSFPLVHLPIRRSREGRPKVSRLSSYDSDSDRAFSCSS